MAASQAANTSKMIGIMVDKIKHIFKITGLPRINSDSIIHFKHSNGDIRCDPIILVVLLGM